MSLNKWHSSHANAHYKHEYSVLNSNWPKNGQSRFGKNAFQLAVLLAGHVFIYLLFQKS